MDELKYLYLWLNIEVSSEINLPPSDINSNQ